MSGRSFARPIRANYKPTSGQDQNPVTNEVTNPNPRTLMDIQNVETYFPRLLTPAKEEVYKEFIASGYDTIDIISAIKLSDNGKRPVNGKIVRADLILTHFIGVRRNDLDDFILFLLSVRELLWYISPHLYKFQEKSWDVPKELSNFYRLNNPADHKHGIKNLDQNILLSLVGGVNAQLEKAYVERPSFQSLQTMASDFFFFFFFFF